MHFWPHGHWQFAVSLIFLTFWLIFGGSPIFGQKHKRQQHSLRENCADEHDKDLLRCTVSSVDCSLDMEKLFPPTESTATDGFPDEGHDLRIEPFAKAITRQQGEKGGQNEQQSVGNHQLMVDISWQTAPNNSTRSLKAFLLEIEGENDRKHACFLLNVSATNWNQEAINASPRLHFSTLAGGTDLLFNFGQTYVIELYSLPERSNGSGSFVHSRFVAPHNPNPLSMPANCSRISNQFASKWTAGFRHIFVHSAARILRVEFVGAPPQYCFEQYEVRLLDESGMELLYSGTVSADEMYKNGSLTLGQYNFTNLEYDQSYIPSVIPVERAADGRCLCPAVFGTDPYDAKIVCSCVAADWKPVRMNRPDVVKLCPGCTLNGSMAILPQIDFDPVGIERKANILWILLLVFNALFLLLIFLLVIAYIRCRLNGTIPRKNQFRRIRLLPPNVNKSNSDAAICSSFANSGTTTSPHSLAIRTDLALGTVSASSSLNIPLIGNEEQQQLASSSSLNLLIIYAHDCAKHEQAVMALAGFLRDTFCINVQLDRWNIDQIEANLTDWLSASVVSADKVLIINSAGAWERYHAKSTSKGRWAVERKKADVLDHIFCAHIDMALQHHSIVSARFAYSPANQIVLTLDGLLQYILPDNISPLISALFGHNMRQDGSLTAAALEENEQWRKMRHFVEEMEILCREEPNWLAENHQRIACKPKAILANNRKMEKIEKEFMVEIVDKSKEEEMEEEQQKEMLNKPTAGNGGEPKMDSGIFDWNGIAEEVAAAGTSANKCHENTVVEGDSIYLRPETEFQEEIASTGWNGTKGEEELTDSGVMVSGDDSDTHGMNEKRIPRHPQKQQLPISQAPPFFATRTLGFQMVYRLPELVTASLNYGQNNGSRTD